MTSTPSLRDAAQKALDALEGVTAYTALLDDFTMAAANKSLEALRAALALPEAEPVAWIDDAALTVARRFTQDGECQRRAALQCAVAEAMRAAQGLGSVRQEPYGWQVAGTRDLFTGEYAETDAKAEARRIGGTCAAFPLYTAPQPAQPHIDAESALLQVLGVVQRYLPPDGGTADAALNKIIGIVDPWPLAIPAQAQPAPVERQPLTGSDAEKAFNTWNLSGASEEADAFYLLNSAGQLERAFLDGLRAGESLHNIKGTA